MQWDRKKTGSDHSARVWPLRSWGTVVRARVLVIPVCFIGAGLLGFRLGTPPRVAGGLVAVGCCHLLALLGARQALAASGGSVAWIHLASQLLFLGGFVAIVWLAAVYPDAEPPRRLLLVAAILGGAGPLMAAMSGSTPSIIDDQQELGPIVGLLPESLATFAAGPLLLLPLLAVGTFGVRYRGATARDRAAMRWPILGLATVALIIIAGNVLGREHESIVTGAFPDVGPNPAASHGVWTGRSANPASVR